jgi:hypothetical protein
MADEERIKMQKKTGGKSRRYWLRRFIGDHYPIHDR